MSDIKIAGNLTIKHWEKTKKKLKPNYNHYWDQAYDFFELRICTRYLKPIDTILNIKSNNGEGFAVVNLQCSLIEMIESFVNGWINEENKWKRNNVVITNSDIGLLKKTKDPIKNVGVFISFFKNRSVFQKYNIEGDKFFWNVRCALLHETQTKNKWKIRKDIDKTGLSYLEKKEEKIIYRENFQRDLKLLIENYKKTIVNGGNFDGIPACVLRENFISKFNHICKQS
ncbi:Protein of unknown function [Flavobacterium indicum GPTSA100-9 = DSM 17447]|uniref:Uncharacterized protein n=1 Tax=Flavobacterium indicum (strain DSM 17447 / CIP 109464 / GPTSA100-9) TaxID=1094466 RepID=H8XTY2_FLAIG|nr:hypothetical protein [Flavobacterium indicum]CCG53712.1 Protein of unknown function [Flavobacterium indicum GPTSA100-9 = DSM 17447]